MQTWLFSLPWRHLWPWLAWLPSCCSMQHAFACTALPPFAFISAFSACKHKFCLPPCRHCLASLTLPPGWCVVSVLNSVIACGWRLGGTVYTMLLLYLPTCLLLIAWLHLTHHVLSHCTFMLGGQDLMDSGQTALNFLHWTVQTFSCKTSMLCPKKSCEHDGIVLCVTFMW